MEHANPICYNILTPAYSIYMGTLCLLYTQITQHGTISVVMYTRTFSYSM